jgi:hypothetical protein
MGRARPSRGIVASAPATRRPATTEDIDAMTPARRLSAYEQGELCIDQLWAWARRYPDEVPLVNDELPWVAFTLGDLD